MNDEDDAVYIYPCNETFCLPLEKCEYISVVSFQFTKHHKKYIETNKLICKKL